MTLAKKIENADPEDDVLFRELFNRAQEDLGLDDAECARLFDVSLPSVLRWKAGSTKPHPNLRKYVYAKLLKALDKQEEEGVH